MKGKAALRSARLEIVGADGQRRLLLALALPEIAHHRQPRHLGHLLARQRGRVGDAAVDHLGAAFLEGQQGLRLRRVGQDQACAAHQHAAATVAQQAMHRLRVEGVGLHAVGAQRLPAEVPAIDLVADAKDILAIALAERRGDLEILLEAVAQIAFGRHQWPRMRTRHDGRPGWRQGCSVFALGPTTACDEPDS
jgi:hypothetical protein